MPQIPIAKQIPHFFSSTHFAVLGASSAPHKYGYKLLSWYLTRPSPISHSTTGVNPKTPIIPVSGTGVHHQTLPSLSTLVKDKSIKPEELSVSVVTPPSASLEAVKEMKRLGIKKVWFQPGAWDEEVVEEGLRGKDGYEWEAFIYNGERDPECGNIEGWCVLVHGEEGIKGAKRLMKL